MLDIKSDSVSLRDYLLATLCIAFSNTYIAVRLSLIISHTLPVYTTFMLSFNASNSILLVYTDSMNSLKSLIALIHYSGGISSF